MNTINSPLSSIQQIGSFNPAAVNAPSESNSFAGMLMDSIKQVNTLQQDADQAVEALFTGENANPAEVLTAVQKADLAFRTMMQIRNKLVQAYDEIKNIRV
jgi:flagellar hook-basal body complex protein FliE